MWQVRGRTYEVEGLDGWVGDEDGADHVGAVGFGLGDFEFGDVEALEGVEAWPQSV